MSGSISVECSEDPCTVTMPNGRQLQTPFVSETSGPGLLQVSGPSGSTKPIRVDFVSNGQLVKLYANIITGKLQAR